ncbi:MAG: hypothetical protein ACFFE8_03255 [Candidatus Heimdallarchaeota archaeon]
MKQKKIGRSRLLVQFMWLECKKLSKFWDAIPKISILLYSMVFVECLLAAAFGWYYPLFLHSHPRALVISSLLVLSIGIFIFTSSSFIAPSKESFFAANPFHVDESDLNILSQTLNDPISWALIGLIRNSLKVLLYVVFLALIIVSYAFSVQIPWPNIVIVLVALYLGIQVFMFAGSFVYSFTEEFLEQLRPRWREQNFSLLNNVISTVAMIIVLGGLGVLAFIDTSEGTSFVILEQMVLDLWFIPPFNLIYLVLAALSKTWPQTYLIQAMISLLFEWAMALGLFFLIHSKIDPLARLYERRPLVDALSESFDLALAGYFIFTSIFQSGASWFKFLQYKNQFLHEAVSLLQKDLLLLDKYRISFTYTLTVLIYGIIVVFWLASAANIIPWFTPAGILAIIAITVFLWFKESRLLVKNLKISFRAVLMEKLFLSFFLSCSLLLAILIINEGTLFLGGIVVYAFSFIFGLIYYSIKPIPY